MLESRAIQGYLPHRYPFVLVDRVLEIIPGKTIVVIKNVSINEPFFQGHFPGNPMMPGVLILEAMAQTISILANYTQAPAQADPASQYVLAAIDRVRFKQFVIPGDQLRIQATVQWKRASFLKCKTQAMVNDQLICTAEITGTRQSMEQASQ